LDSFDRNNGPRSRTATQQAEQETLKLGVANRENAGGEDGSEQDAEARMRLALGLFGQRPSHSEPRQSEQAGERRQTGGHMQVGTRRHRFVQDGEVPVSVVRGRRDQIAPEARDRLAEEQLADRAGREQAERKLAEAQILLRTLQTRLGHAELERDEAVEELRIVRDQLAAARVHLPPAAPEKPVEDRRETDAVVRGDEKEPEPVKWWL
jgi:hypothetical protein